MLQTSKETIDLIEVFQTIARNPLVNSLVRMYNNLFSKNQSHVANFGANKKNMNNSSTSSANFKKLGTGGEISVKSVKRLDMLLTIGFFKRSSYK